MCHLDDAAFAEVSLKSVSWVSILWLSPFHQSSILEICLHRWWVKLGLESQNLWLNSVISLSLSDAANWLISISLVA